MKIIILSDAKDTDGLIQLIRLSIDELKSAKTPKECGIVINGSALALALLPECRNHFLDLALLCEVCICCRVSPKQKAEVSIYFNI